MPHLLISEKVCVLEKQAAEKEKQNVLEEKKWQERDRLAHEAFCKKMAAEEKIIREREEREVNIIPTPACVCISSPQQGNMY